MFTSTAELIIDVDHSANLFYTHGLLPICYSTRALHGLTERYQVRGEAAGRAMGVGEGEVGVGMRINVSVTWY